MIEKEFIIRRGISDNYPRQLILNEKFLKFENKNRFDDQFTTFEKNEITDYCFGVKWMRYKFVFGREYVILVRNQSNQVLKINFKTYFGRKKNEYHDLCNDIIKTLWDLYFDQITSNFITKIENNEKLIIGDVKFNNQGLEIITNSSLKQKSALISWENVRTKTYVTYFAIYSVEDPININRGYSYLNDWNSVVLRATVRTILKRKNIENE